MIIKSNDFEESLFEFDMRSLYIEQELISETLKERYRSIQGINESEDKSIVDKFFETISKIFDNIRILLDKAILNIRKVFQGISFESAKKRIEKIRTSTNEPKEIDFDLLIPSVPLMKHDQIKNFTVDYLGFKLTSNSFYYKKDGILFKQLSEYDKKSDKNDYIKGYAIRTVALLMKLSEDEIEKFDGDVNEQIEKEKITKNNCRNNFGKVEQQLKEIESYIKSDFKNCIDVLAKLRQESRKISVAVKVLNPITSDREEKKNVKTMMLQGSMVYSEIVRFATKYLFQSTSLYIKCLNKNVSNFSNALL